MVRDAMADVNQVLAAEPKARARRATSLCRSNAPWRSCKLPVTPQKPKICD